MTDSTPQECGAVAPGIGVCLKIGEHRKHAYTPVTDSTTRPLQEPKGIGVQVFHPDIMEIEPGDWRFVRYEKCPQKRRQTCKDENHHWGRGDHVVPVNPDWKIGDTA